ncbi:MAG: TrmH family RNA methyltransferase [Pirellulales bacterium]
MAEFEHQRHKPPRRLAEPRQLVVACCPLRSNVNLSRIVRAAACDGIDRLICAGNPRVIDRIARDGPASIQLEKHRTLVPVLRKLREEGYRLVGLEQTTGSIDLYEFEYSIRTVLIVGNERNGLGDDVLEIVDDIVEIPVYGLPFSHNVATATAIAMYEYCRQYPDG